MYQWSLKIQPNMSWVYVSLDCDIVQVIQCIWDVGFITRFFYLWNYLEKKKKTESKMKAGLIQIIFKS